MIFLFNKVSRQCLLFTAFDFERYHSKQRNGRSKKENYARRKKALLSVDRERIKLSCYQRDVSTETQIEAAG